MSEDEKLNESKSELNFDPFKKEPEKDPAEIPNKRAIEEFDLTKIKTKDIKAVELPVEEIAKLTAQVKSDISRVRKVGEVLAILSSASATVLKIGAKLAV